jgi:hypothetical protein
MVKSYRGRKCVAYIGEFEGVSYITAMEGMRQAHGLSYTGCRNLKP